MKQNFQKNKVATGKTVFFVIGSFCNPVLFVLTLASERAVLSEYIMLSIIVLLTTKRYSILFFKLFSRKFVSKV